MKKFIEKLHVLPETREEAWLEWKVAATMALTAAFMVGAAVMVYASTFRGWLP